MPQLIAFGAAGVACFFATRWLTREFARVDTQMTRAQRMLNEARAVPPPVVRFNPRTGLYQPAD